VRGSTATKLLLGTIGGMTLLLLLIGDRREALPMLVMLVLVGGLLYLTYRIREMPRRDAYRDTARTLGLAFEPTDTRGLSGLPHPLIHRLAETRDIAHVLSGTWRGIDVVAFEYRYTSGTNAQGQANVFAYTCAVIPVPSSWPDLVVEPERVPTKVADALGLRDIDMELESFNRAFEVRSSEPRFASALLDARMMEWLMTSAPAAFGVEIVGGRLLGFVPEVYPWQTESLLVTVKAFLDQVPSIVGSLYPGPATP
jgi:hypothetical protein